MEDRPDTESHDTSVACAECGTELSEGQDRETTDDGVFCRPCFNNLTAQLHQAIEAQSTDINYTGALAGALAGAALGVLAWWGFTVLTEIAFGLVAVVIGFATGRGTVMLSGGKRHVNLQVLSVVVATLGFVYATYLVNRTFIQQAYVEQGEALVLPWLPGPTLLIEVVRLGVNFMDLVFLAIVVWEAWRYPAPVRLAA